MEDDAGDGLLVPEAADLNIEEADGFRPNTSRP
jgi:hypothetical protein